MCISFGPSSIIVTSIRVCNVTSAAFLVLSECCNECRSTTVNKPLRFGEFPEVSNRNHVRIIAHGLRTPERQGCLAPQTVCRAILRQSNQIAAFVATSHPGSTEGAAK